MSNISDRICEILDLLQEECAEVIQQRSKIRRFGPDFVAKGGTAPFTSLGELQREIWDVLIFIDLLEKEGYIDKDYSFYFQNEKYDKLRKWTTLYDDVTD